MWGAMESYNSTTSAATSSTFSAVEATSTLSPSFGSGTHTSTFNSTKDGETTIATTSSSLHSPGLLHRHPATNFSFGGITSGDLFIGGDNDLAGIAQRGLSVPELKPDGNITVDISCDGNWTWCQDSDHSKTRVFNDADLWAENDAYALKLVPAMVFVAILMIPGIFGNLLVVYVYGCRFKAATQHFLVVCLACFDLLISCIAMPTEITDMRFHHTFSSLFACKLLRFITMFSSISSSFTLVTIAVDRHRRVTRPLSKQMTLRHARLWELVNVLVSAFFSWPLLVMTGLRSSDTRIPGLIGTDCSFSNQFQKTKYPLAYNAMLGAGFIILTIVLGVLYFRIWKRAKGHRVYMASRNRSSTSGTSIVEPRREGSVFQNMEVDVHMKVGGEMNGNVRGSHGTVRSGTPVIILSKDIVYYCPHSDNQTHSDSCPDETQPKTLPSEKWSNGDITLGDTSDIAEGHGKTGDDTDCTQDDVTTNSNIPAVAFTRGTEQLNHNLIMNSPTGRNSDSDRDPPDLNSGKRDPQPLRPDDAVRYKGCSPTGACNHGKALSPLLKMRMLTSQPSVSPSITSDDLRPMSSLIESVSKSLAQRPTLSAVSAQPRTWDAQLRPCHVDGCSTCTDHQHDHHAGEPREGDDLEQNSRKYNYGPCSGRHCKDALSDDESTYRGVDHSTHGQNHSKQTCPESVGPKINDCDDGSSNLTASTNLGSMLSVGNRSVQIANVQEDESQGGMTKEPGSNCMQCAENDANVHMSSFSALSVSTDNLGLNDSSCTDITTDSIPVCDFSHLIGPRLRPMAIPAGAVRVSDLDDVSVASGSTAGYFQRNNESSEITSDPLPSDLSQDKLSVSIDRLSVSDHKDIASNRLSSSSSTYSKNKRRGTVVSILERYRNRSESTFSVDNATIASYVSRGKLENSKNLDKTTIVAFAVTSVFVLSFVPYLALMFVRAFKKDFDYRLDDASLCVYNIFIRFYFLNSALNPLLYGWLNTRFRRECKRLLRCCRWADKKGTV